MIIFMCQWSGAEDARSRRVRMPGGFALRQAVILAGSDKAGGPGRGRSRRRADGLRRGVRQSADAGEDGDREGEHGGHRQQHPGFALGRFRVALGHVRPQPLIGAFVFGEDRVHAFLQHCEPLREIVAVRRRAHAGNPAAALSADMSFDACPQTGGRLNDLFFGPGKSPVRSGAHQLMLPDRGLLLVRRQTLPETQGRR